MTAHSAPLIQVLNTIASELPEGQVLSLATCVGQHAAPNADGRRQAAGLVASPRFAAAVATLWTTWMQHPEVTGQAIDLALRTAACTVEQLRSSQVIDIAWTGPSSAHVPVRLSSQVLLEIIDGSTAHLTVVSFAAYKVRVVIDALKRAAQRGVDVRLILETAEDSDGRLSQDAADAFTELHHLATFWVWPHDQRPTGGASMHAKAAVADRTVALVTSANLTGHALDRNMELGVLIRGGPVPRRLSDHFHALTAAGVIVQVQPH